MGSSDQKELRKSFPAIASGNEEGQSVSSGHQDVKIKVAGLVHDYFGNMIFVLRQHAGDGKVSIEPPGGKLEDGETLISGTRRELGEELGGFHLTRVDEKVLVSIEDVFRKAKGEQPQKRCTYYMDCKTVLGFHFNALPNEHLAILHVPVFKPQSVDAISASYHEMKSYALASAQKKLDQLGIVPNGKIEFRLPEKAFSAYYQASLSGMRSELL
ncbi:MAG: NUDIX hydrolase [Pseudobdellovibrionaceae bacterium]|jgi:hypothetical protein|nr:NUDIX hydrolase [Pseudobdellovibrionaceae bacterium]